MSKNTYHKRYAINAIFFVLFYILYQTHKNKCPNYLKNKKTILENFPGHFIRSSNFNFKTL